MPVSKTKLCAVVDGREFGPRRVTGISRVVEGLVDALLATAVFQEVCLGVVNPNFLPGKLKAREPKLKLTKLPRSFLAAERKLSNLTRYDASVFISPYPKFPLFGVHCPAIHIIHDVLDLTHPTYKNRLKVFFDRYRLRKALSRADITWYDSSWSMNETQKHFGRSGKNPKVRYPGIHDAFQPEKKNDDDKVLEVYGLKVGYILALGNGMPHKNLGILLEITPRLERSVVFAGASDVNRQYWESRHSGTHATWIKHVEEPHLPALLRGAFCLVQPSLIEGYGYPPLEAMACGKPAIVSSIPVLVETTGNFALTASPTETEDWIKALRFLENTSHYEDSIEKGLRWTEPLRRRKAWEPYLEDIENLMKGI